MQLQISQLSVLRQWDTGSELQWSEAEMPQEALARLEALPWCLS